MWQQKGVKMKTLKFISSRLNKNCLYALCLSIAFIITGCAPSFPEFQGADLVGKGKIKVTPYLTTTYSDDESEELEMIDLLFQKQIKISITRIIYIRF